MAWYEDPPRECHECGRSDTLEKRGNEWWCTDCEKKVKKK